MSNITENGITEFKSLRKVISPEGKYNTEGLRDLVVTCVCLANAQGGIITIGIEDKDREPPVMQSISDEVVNTTITRLRSLCFNVGLAAGEIMTHDNGSHFFNIIIHPSLKSIATTADGKIYIRIGDQCHAARSEDIHRLASEKDAFQWEIQPQAVTLDQIPEANLRAFADGIRESKRVKAPIKELSDVEIAEHYNLVDRNQMTHLGVLWLGTPSQRSRLAYPLTVQYIVYDDLENKVRKVDWHDNIQNPKDLLLDIEKQAVELTYFDEFPQGLFRKQIRHYDARVIRELLINAIAHKCYTISGDIFIKVYNDRLEISNPGGLPLGITKENILHSTNRRNPHLIRILHDLELMEGEGTGYNLMYAITGRDAKPFPVPDSDYNSTTVTQSSTILDEEAVLLLDFIAKHYVLSQKEFIVLGIVARYRKILTTQLTKLLQLSEEDRLRSYVGKLLDQAILVSRGIKKGKEYLINPKLIADSKIDVKPTLKMIEAPRLKALIEETLKLSPSLTMNELQRKLGDVPLEDVKKLVYRLTKAGILEHTPDRTYRKYWLAKKSRSEVEK
jgi:ATP-dependent DNA helicase RecG